VNFENWFEIATKNITETERSRIRNELEAHVFDTIEAHQQTGITTLEAEQKAVLELGDPKIAARGFTQSFLTVQEAKRLGLNPGKHDALIQLGVIAAISVAMMSMLYIGQSKYGDLPVTNTVFNTVFGIQAFGICAMLLGKFEHQLLRRNPVFRTFVFTSSLGNLFMLAGLYMLTQLPAPMTVPVYLAASIGLLTIVGWFHSELPILRKLQTRA
jgi:hypothetical protein